MNTTMNPEAPAASDYDTRAPLRRSAQGRMAGGVAAGLARYLGLDATLVRIAFLVLIIFTGAGLPLYLAGWLLIPEEGSDQSIASAFIESRRTKSR